MLHDLATAQPSAKTPGTLPTSPPSKSDRAQADLDRAGSGGREHVAEVCDARRRPCVRVVPRGAPGLGLVGLLPLRLAHCGGLLEEGVTQAENKELPLVSNR